MDTEQQTCVQKKPEAKAAAKIVRTISDIEQSYISATGPLSERLMTEIGEVAGKAAHDTWEVESTEWELFITSPDWKCTRGRARGDAWLELGDIIEDVHDHSWIAVAVGAGAAQMCLELKFRNGLTPIDTCLKSSPQLLAKLAEQGFELRDDRTRLLLPIKVESDALAKAFESGNFEVALTPVRHAIRSAAAVQQEITDLVGLARMKAKQG